MLSVFLPSHFLSLMAGVSSDISYFIAGAGDLCLLSHFVILAMILSVLFDVYFNCSLATLALKVMLLFCTFVFTYFLLMCL